MNNIWLYKIAKKHLEENKMTYCEHFRFAIFYAILCFIAFIFLAIHALLPCFFQTTGSDLVKKLAKRFNTRTE